MSKYEDYYSDTDEKARSSPHFLIGQISGTIKYLIRKDRVKKSDLQDVLDLIDIWEKLRDDMLKRGQEPGYQCKVSYR